MIVAMLFYNHEDQVAAMPQEETNAMVERHIKFNREVVGRHALLMTNRALEPTSRSVTVWPTESGTPQQLVQGPFDRPALTLSGFYLVDCDDMDQAIALASEYPMPPGLGCIEVRPAMQQWDYVPSIDIDALAPDEAFSVLSDLHAWPDWLNGVEQVSVTSQGVGSIRLLGREPASLAVTECDHGSHRLGVELRFSGADAALLLHLSAEQLPRNGCRVSLGATVPRALLDTLGSTFSDEINAALRGGLSSFPVSRTRRAID